MCVEMVKMGTLLSGRLLGIKAFAQVCERLSAIRPGEMATLDFSGVEYVSASWISAMLVPLSRRAAEENNDFFFVITNFPTKSLDDLQLVADQAHVPFLVSDKKHPGKARLIGALDSGQHETLTAVLKFGEVTGAELADKCRELETKGPAWNNRLRDLFEKRLLRRQKKGREQIYSSVVPEVILDG